MSAPHPPLSGYKHELADPSARSSGAARGGTGSLPSLPQRNHNSALSAQQDPLKNTGSAAVVESLWSMYDAFNSKRRRGMSPITVEMILFLKKNKDLWGIEDVARANQNRLKDNRNERVHKKIAEHEELMRYLDLEGVDW